MFWPCLRGKIRFTGVVAITFTIIHIIIAVVSLAVSVEPRFLLVGRGNVTVLVTALHVMADLDAVPMRSCVISSRKSDKECSRVGAVWGGKARSSCSCLQLATVHSLVVHARLENKTYSVH